MRIPSRDAYEKIDRMIGQSRCPGPGKDEELTINRNIGYVGGGIWTPNEVREKLGDEPHPDGDGLKPQASANPFGGFGGQPGNDDPKKALAKAGGRALASIEQEDAPPQYSPQAISKRHDGPGESPKAPGLRAALVRIFRRQLRQTLDILDNLKSGSAQIIKGDERLLEGHHEFVRLFLDIDTLDESVITDTQAFLDAQISLGVANGTQQVRSLGIAFDLEPTDALEFVRTEQRKFITRFATNINETTAKQLQDQFEEALSLGESIGKLKKRVQGVYQHATRHRAEAIARSETKRALEAGQKASYVKAGVGQMQWIAGPDACPFCQQFDNRIIATQGENFANQGDTVSADFTLEDGSTSRRSLNLGFSDTPHPPLHPNCFAGDTYIIADEIQRVYRRWHCGELLKIRTTFGNEIRCTPNHPIETRRGFVPANRLSEGDHVIGQLFSQHGNLGDRDVQDIPVRIEEAFGTLAESGLTERVSSMHIQFHGDGGHGDVDVITVDRQLGLRQESAFDQPSRQHQLSSTDEELHASTSGSPLCSCGRAVHLATPSRPGGHESLASFGRSATLVAEQDSFAHGSQNGVCATQDLIDRTTADIERPGDVLDRFSRAVAPEDLLSGQPCIDLRTAHTNAALPQSPDNGSSPDAQQISNIVNRQAGTVFLDQIIDIEIEPFHGYVYNLETKRGGYHAFHGTLDDWNGQALSVENCTCFVVPVI